MLANRTLVGAARRGVLLEVLGRLRPNRVSTLNERAMIERRVSGRVVADLAMGHSLGFICSPVTPFRTLDLVLIRPKNRKQAS